MGLPPRGESPSAAAAIFFLVAALIGIAWFTVAWFRMAGWL